MNRQPQLVSQICEPPTVGRVCRGVGWAYVFYGGFLRKDLLKVLAYLLLPSLRHFFCLENDSLTMSILGRFNQGGAPTIVISKWSDIGAPTYPWFSRGAHLGFDVGISTIGKWSSFRWCLQARSFWQWKKDPSLVVWVLMASQPRARLTSHKVKGWNSDLRILRLHFWGWEFVVPFRNFFITEGFTWDV